MTELGQILQQFLNGQPLSEAQWAQLIHWELADLERAQAWQITPVNVRSVLDERLGWLRQVAPLHPDLPLPSQPLEIYLPLYWQLWLPLALRLRADRQQQAHPLIEGFLGGQGTGKTTLTQILQRFLQAMGYHTVGLSIDDLYKTYADRQQLKVMDPRLIWRGPPGTHDISLGIETLKSIRQTQPGQVAYLPRFDKSLHSGEGDRVAPEPVQDVDIVLFEGWFLGMRPVARTCFEGDLPDPISTSTDRQFAADMNERLRDYLPLWELLDRLVILCPEDYRMSQQWRRQAEHRMKATGKAGMSDETINEFVTYFWKALHPEVFLPPLKAQGDWVDLVIEIGTDRVPRKIYSPKTSAVLQ
ncbi:MAG TPA: glycerate kinase [Leptolyngbyaceae cyanobacterium]